MATDLAAGRRRRGHPVRWAVMAVSAVVLLPLVVVLGSRLGKDATLGQRSVLIGKPAPEFTLTNIDGGSISSADLAGRPYVVNFWASWCVPCRQEHPNLEAFYARYRSRGVELLGVMFNDTPDGARAYRRELGGDWPLLQDAGDRAAVNFGVTGPPETFVVDDAGIVVHKIRAAVGPGELEAVFTELGMPPAG